MLRNELYEIYAKNKAYSEQLQNQEGFKEIAAKMLIHISLDGFICVDDGEDGCFEYENPQVVTDANIDELIAFLNEKPEITELSLHHHAFSIKSFNKLSQVTTVKKLVITDHWMLNEDCIKALTNNRNINELSLDRCKITDEMLGVFTESTGLRYLSLKDNYITESGLKILINKTDIQEIDVQENILLSDYKGEKIIKRFSNAQAITSLGILPKISIADKNTPNQESPLAFTF